MFVEILLALVGIINIDKKNTHFTHLMLSKKK